MSWIRTSLVMAVVGSASIWLAGCEMVDESAPSRPRTTFLPEGGSAQENAEKRALEAPAREGPMMGRERIGGQTSSAPAALAGPKVVTLAAGGYSKPVVNALLDSLSRLVVRPYEYRHDYYRGPLPHIPQDPGTTPQPGGMQVPGTDWWIDASWGQGMQLQDYPHRPWPETQANYQAAQVVHNPIYYFKLQELLPVKQNDGSYTGDVVSTFYEVPWFYGNTVLLPLLIPLELPFTQHSTSRLGADPIYFGYLPAGGAIVPTPAPAPPVAPAATDSTAPASSTSAPGVPTSRP